MVPLGSGAEREIDDVMLSRYACYLVVMNGDPNKEVIAVGQIYFVVKIHQQELIDNYEQLSKVRQTIKELGGTIPEDLPTPEKIIA